MPLRQKKQDEKLKIGSGGTPGDIRLTHDCDLIIQKAELGRANWQPRLQGLITTPDRNETRDFTAKLAGIEPTFGRQGLSGQGFWLQRHGQVGSPRRCNRVTPE